MSAQNVQLQTDQRIDSSAGKQETEPLNLNQDHTKENQHPTMTLIPSTSEVKGRQVDGGTKDRLLMQHHEKERITLDLPSSVHKGSTPRISQRRGSLQHNLEDAKTTKIHSPTTPRKGSIGSRPSQAIYQRRGSLQYNQAAEIKQSLKLELPANNRNSNDSETDSSSSENDSSEDKGRLPISSQNSQRRASIGPVITHRLHERRGSLQTNSALSECRCDESTKIHHLSTPRHGHTNVCQRCGGHHKPDQTNHSSIASATEMTAELRKFRKPKTAFGRTMHEEVKPWPHKLPKLKVNEPENGQKEHSEQHEAQKEPKNVDDYINECIAASETIFISKNALPKGSDTLNQLLGEFSPSPPSRQSPDLLELPLPSARQRSNSLPLNVYKPQLRTVQFNA